MLPGRIGLFLFVLILFFSDTTQAQEPPYIFTVVTKQPDAGNWLVNYNTGYGVRTVSPFGADGFEQRVGVSVGFSKRLSLLAGGGVLINRDSKYEGDAISAELLGHLLSADQSPVELSIGGGVRRDYEGVSAATLRFIAGKSFDKWNISSNALFEKAFDSLRDKVDVVTMLGVSRQMHRRFRGGIEIVAEDLEGFWEEEEAEGGAKILIGPTIHFNGIHKDVFLTIGAGRVYYLTESTASSQAIRLLPTMPGKDGYVARATLTYMR